jgi:hypothetical protein
MMVKDVKMKPFLFSMPVNIENLRLCYVKPVNASYETPVQTCANQHLLKSSGELPHSFGNGQGVNKNVFENKPEELYKEAA